MKHIFYILILVSSLLAQSHFGQELSPGDGIRIILYNVSDEVTGDYFVQEDGALQLPYIGIISVNGREINSLKEEIHLKYDSLYKQPELSVQALFKIKILGEVKNPGTYYVTGVEKFSDILSLAGGETADSDLSDIILNRQGRNETIDAREIIEEGNEDLDVILSSGDSIFVPRRWWVGFQNTAFLISGLAVIATIIGIFTR